MEPKDSRYMPHQAGFDYARYKYLVFAIFFSSGISGLVYEVVWLRMLSRIMGVTIYATSTVLAAFMAGLALGSFLFGRYIDRSRSPLKVYAFLEFLIGVTALLVPLIFSVSVPLFKYVYQASGESAFSLTLLRTAVTFIALLVPTTMMGGTLPILTSWLVRREKLFGKSFGLLYGINTFGAVAGVFLSGYITIGLLGEWATMLLGFVINMLVALIAYFISRKEASPQDESAEPEPTSPRRISPYPDKIRRIVLIAFAVSGFTSLAYEVIWTRQLILFLETSIYAFSAMLIVFLFGLARGSIFMNAKVDRFEQPLLVFGAFELVIGLLSIANLYLFSAFDSQLAIRYLGVARVVLATICIVFPMTFLFGMIFPTAAVCYAKDAANSGSSVGWLYSANTIGSIAGSLATGFLLIPRWGSTKAVLILACLNFGLGLLFFGLERGKSRMPRIIGPVALAVLGLLVFQVSGQDPFLATLEKRIAARAPESLSNPSKSYKIYYNKEGLEGTVTAFSLGKDKSLWINGIGMTELCTETKLIAHLPLMFAREPKEFLVICFGMGGTVRSAALYPGLDITAVELVPEVYQTFKYYYENAEEILRMKNVKTIVNDGRNFLLLSTRRYDVISVDPAPPIWSAGTVNLYTREFFQLCRDRLTPGGVMCLWFPGGTMDETKSLLKTFYKVFPNTVVYRGPRHWGFYLIGLMEEVSPLEFREKVEKAFKNPVVLADLGEIDQSCLTPRQLQNLLLWDKKEVDAVSREGVLITDDYPYTEFFLWRRIFGQNQGVWFPPLGNGQAGGSGHFPPISSRGPLP
jgi:spermidine synthase